MNDCYALLGADGPLAGLVDGFQPREAQQHMAAAVAGTLETQDRLIVEAGTGTGKTFAYLVPVLDSGKRIIISTGTRHLQDQLYTHDLPVVRAALKSPVRCALLKGRANYLCQHRLEATAVDGRQLTRRQQHDLALIRDWAGRTTDGDIAELGGVSEDSPLWPRVTSTVDNCLGQECGSYQTCFVVRARRAALDADILVINHHLLFADMLLKEEGFGELLPGADAVIIDEAHQIPEIASLFFGTTVSSHQLQELARDSQTEHLHEAGDMAALPEAALRLEGMLRRFRLVLGEAERRASWAEVADNAGVREALQALESELGALVEWLGVAAARGKGLDNCWQRGKCLIRRLQTLQEEPGADSVYWFETRRQSFRLNVTPLDVAPGFRRSLEMLPQAWIFTSATLAVGASFSHFAARLGLEEAQTLQLESPFDYRNNTLLYLPDKLPEPNSPGYTRAVVDCARQMIAASRGRIFLLFTSHQALQEAARLLAGSVDYPLLVQGSAPRSELLEQFRSLGNAVLLGTSSFWEGVDVRGNALSCVLIDRLPFASPGDPVLQARIDALRAQGRNPFVEFQLPNAVIALKQGVGRLIRDVDDRGVLVLCDPRLRTRSYGRVFLNSLPDMPVSDDPLAVSEFFSGVTASRTSCGVARHILTS